MDDWLYECVLNGPMQHNVHHFCSVKSFRINWSSSPCVSLRVIVYVRRWLKYEKTLRSTGKISLYCVCMCVCVSFYVFTFLGESFFFSRLILFVFSLLVFLFRWRGDDCVTVSFAPDQSIKQKRTHMCECETDASQQREKNAFSSSSSFLHSFSLHILSNFGSK